MSGTAFVLLMCVIWFGLGFVVAAAHYGARGPWEDEDDGESDGYGYVCRRGDMVD